MNLLLSDNLSLQSIDYANQGNSIIGIRGSGKTYTATKIAEELIKSGIPIIAFDPTGVWQNLRYGVNGYRGLPVVVAGGMNGDIALNEENSIDIVAAALKENVSLIIDLQGTSTSNKSKWMRIVSDCIEFLIGNNQAHGLRHVFIEEAAEFVPQKPSPGGALVYSRIESMARIGRNFGLGYTLINQRSEEISKAVFEISELVLVHRQSGKNSLNSIHSWLQLRGQPDQGIVKTLPGLSSGQCWAIDNTREMLIKVLPKQTLHPDPKKGTVTLNNLSKADVSEFIGRINSQINKDRSSLTLPAKPTFSFVGSAVNGDTHIIEQLEAQNKNLTAENKLLKESVETISIKFNEALAALNQVNSITAQITAVSIKATKRDQVVVVKSMPIKDEKSITNHKSVTGGAFRILQAAVMYYPKQVSKQRLATIAGLSANSGSFSTYLSTLKRNDLISGAGKTYIATKTGVNHAGPVNELPKDPVALVEMWCKIIGNGSGAARILRYLCNEYPKPILKSQIGAAVELAPTSGSFSTYLTTLKRNGLITAVGGAFKAADELYIN